MAEKQREKPGYGGKTYEDDNVLKYSSLQERQSFTVPKTRWKDGNRKEGKCFLITDFLRICQNNVAGSIYETVDDEKACRSR